MPQASLKKSSFAVSSAGTFGIMFDIPGHNWSYGTSLSGWALCPGVKQVICDLSGSHLDPPPPQGFNSYREREKWLCLIPCKHKYLPWPGRIHLLFC